MTQPQTPSPLALVIDDQKDIRDIVRLSLQCEGWRVMEAPNGRQGLELLRAHRPDLILSDLMMPEMSGLELCRKLIDELGMASVPVLLISGINKGAKLLKDFWEMPLERKDFLSKPFDASDLLRCVRKLVPSPAAQPAPPRPAPSPQPAKPSSSQDHLGGYRILVIDDDSDICLIMKTGLGFCHTVQTAANGMEGLEALDRFMPDFVISDINMPVMNGLETAEAIRRHPLLYDVPIFFLTGETDKSLPRKAFDVGGNLYLSKPVDPFQLLKYIDHFLKETGLKPGQHGPARPAPAQPAPSRPAAPQPPASGPVRILTVEADAESRHLLKTLLETGVPGGPFELLWADDPRLALGNLPRWEPDLILYDPRNPGLDGVAFGQTLALQKLTDQQQIAFIGKRFFEVEIQYSRNHFKRGVIALEGGSEAVTRQLEEAVRAAGARLRPKRLPIGQILSEEAERLRQLEALNSRQSRERDILRRRYAGIQDFIDKQL